MARILKLQTEYEQYLDGLLDELFWEFSRLGLSNAEVARRANLAPGTIHCLDHRRTRRPQIHTLWKLVRVVGWELRAVKATSLRRRAAE